MLTTAIPDNGLCLYCSTSYIVRSAITATAELLVVLTQALVGQRYSSSELPTTIHADDFERIRAALSSYRSRDVELLDACYELDENSVEPERVYVLTNRNFDPSLADSAQVCDTRWDFSRFLLNLLHFCARRATFKNQLLDQELI